MTTAWREEMRLPGAPGDVQRASPASLCGLFVLTVLICSTSGQMRNYCDPRRRGAPDGLHASYIVAGDLGTGVILDRCLAENPIRVGVGSYVSGLNCPEGELESCCGPGHISTTGTDRCRGWSNGGVCHPRCR